MARTEGATGKKKNGLKVIVGIGVPPMKPTEKGMPKVVKAKGKSSTQGAKPMSKMPNSMRSKMPKM